MEQNPFEDLPEDSIHMLTQPLLTEEGFINDACMRELICAINNMPKTYDRLKDDKEWSIKQYTFHSDILGALADTIVRQFKRVPPNFEIILNYVDSCLKVSFFTDESIIGEFYMDQYSLVDINKMLWDILGDFSKFLEWNDSDIVGKNWIDLDACLHQVCILIRDERRHFYAFNKKFDEEYNKPSSTLEIN